MGAGVNLWIMFFVIWVVAEIIQAMRRKPLRNRLKVAAIWAAVITALAAIGQATRNNGLLFDLTMHALFGLAALAFYWIRIWLANLWVKRTT